MKRLLRILLLVLTLAWASAGEAVAAREATAHEAAAAHHGRTDRLRWNAITDQPSPMAVLTDSHAPLRLCPTRPQRVSPSGDPKTQPTHGRTQAALHSLHHHSFFCTAGVGRQSGLALLCARHAPTFLVLRHIIR